MTTVKQELHEAKMTVYQSQHEAGLRALLTLVTAQRETALANWRRASAIDLTLYQANYNAAQAVIDFITKKPTDLGVAS